MAVDRGGLHYNIKIVDSFSAGLRRFRDDLKKAREEMEKLRKSTAKGTTPSAQDTQREERAAKRKKRALTIEEQAEKKLARVQKTRAVNEEVQRKAAERNISLSRKTTRELNAQAAAQKKLAADRSLVKKLEIERKALLAQHKIRENNHRLVLKRQKEQAAAARQRGKFVDDYRRKLLKEIALEKRANAEAAKRQGLGGVQTTGGRASSKAAANNLKRTAAAARSANSAGTRMLFTFRRLFGILAAFTAARYAAQGVASLVRQMVEFNRVVETAELGIASLITASGGVRDSLGNTVSSGQQLALAQKEAAKQTALLRLEGLKTAATFEQLVDTFQIALGPGLAAGLDLQQIRKFTVQVSQAASAAGVAQNQLSEEIRSILSGTIQQRTTRLAAVLGITNEDIRRAKEAGVLVEFLNEKFKAFSDAGDVALTTFTALASNAADALSQLLGAGGIEFFNSLKGLLQDSINLLTDIDPAIEGIQPDPEAVEIVAALASGLERAVQEARRLGQSFGFNDLFAGAQAVGDAVGFAAEITGRLVEGFVKGANDLLSIFSEVADTVSRVTGISLVEDDSLAGVVRLVTLVSGLVLSLSAIKSLLLAVNTTMSLVATKAALSAVGVAAVAIALGVAASKAKDFNSYVNDSETSWGQILASAEALGRYAISNLVLFLKEAYEEIKAYSYIAIQGVREAINQAFLGFQTDVYRALGVFSSEFEKEAKKIAEQKALDLATTVKIIKEEKKRLDNFKKQIDLEQRLAEIRFNKDRDAIRRDPEAFNLGAAASKAAEGLTSTLKDGISGLGDLLGAETEKALKSTVEAQTKLNRLVESLSPVIVKNRETLEEQTDLQRASTDEVVKATEALKLQRATLEATGTLRSQITEGLKSEVQLANNLRKLEREKDAEAKSLAATKKQQFEVEEDISKLSAEAQERVKGGQEAVTKIINLNREREEQLNQIRIKELEIQAAQKEGETGFLRSLGLQQARGLLEQTEKQIVDLKKQAEGLLSGDEKEADLIKSKIELQGRRLAIEQQIKEITLEQQELVRRAQTAQALDLTRNAEREAEDLRARIARSEAALGDRRKDQGKPSTLLQAEKALRLQELEVDNTERAVELEQEQVAALLRQQQIRATNLQKQLDTAEGPDRGSILKSVETTEKSIAALREQQSLSARRGALQLEEQNLTLGQVRGKLQRIANLTGQNGFLAGLGQTIKDQLADIPTAFQATFNVIQGIGNAFASSLSSLVVDALDPTKEVDLVERFRQLMQSIVQVVIQELARIAIAKAIAAIGSAAAGGLFGSADTGTPVTSSAGGITSTYGSGLAEGTERVSTPNSPQGPRPKGLPASDTVNAWLTPGEAVIKRQSAQRAGYDFMKLFNEGKLDYSALRMVAGLTSRKRGKQSFSRRGPGYAAGGAVSAAATGGGGGGAGISIVVPSEEHADRILAQGRGALEHLLRQNRGSFRSALGI